MTVELKELASTDGVLERIVYIESTRTAFFTLQDCSDTLSFSPKTEEQRVALALSKPGDRVSVKVISLPPTGRLCEVARFTNLDLTLEH